MLGTIVNTVAIILGSVLGSLINGGIPQKINDSIMKALALSVILIGVSGSLKNINIMLIIISMVTGCIIGEVMDIDGSLKKLGDKLGNKFGRKGGKLSEAFVSSSLIFCVGAMAIVGSLESGLTGSNKTLFVKSVLDGITAIVFSSSMGIGVALSAIVVFIYQTILTLGAASLKGVLTTVVINNMTSIGNLLIVGIGFNILKIDRIKVANLIPAVFIPIFYQFVMVFVK